MTTYGWTAAGFVRKPESQIRADVVAKLPAQWINGDDSIVGKVVDAVVPQISSVWDVLQSIADSLNRDAAEGRFLDNLADLVPFTRLALRTTAGDVAVTGGLPSTTVAAGAVLDHTSSGTRYVTTADVDLDGSGDGTLSLESQDAGAFTVDDSDAFTFVSPALTPTSVAADGDFTPGRLEESDAELRLRLIAGDFQSGAGTDPSIRAALLEIASVTHATVTSNRTDDTDADGVPPHSLHAVVHPTGAEGADIALALWEHQPSNFSTYGTESATVTDEDGESQTVWWSNPSESDIYVDTTLVTDDDFVGASAVKAAIIAYINALDPGADVVWYQLVKVVGELDGVVQVTALTVGTTASPSGTTNVAIAATAIAVGDASRVTVTS